MFGFGSSKGHIRYGAIFDVGSESVGIAIVASNQSDEYPRVLFSHRVHMRITAEELGLDERMRHMKEALFSASLIISRDGLEALRLDNPHGRIKDILLTVSAPWSHTVSRNVAYKGESELKISRNLIDELVSSAEQEISEQIQAENPEHKKGFSVVEQSTIDVRINDYPVSNPLGLKGTEISLVHITGLMPHDIIDAVAQVRDKILPNVPIRSHSFLLVLYCVLRELLPDHNSLSVIHVTGETTELGIVENDTLIESISIPYGLNFIVRSYMQGGNHTAKEVHSLLELYHQNHLSEKEREEVEKVLARYTESLGTALSAHTNVRRFPGKTIILAPASFTELFKTILNPIIKEKLGTAHDLETLPSDILGTTATHDERDMHIPTIAHFFHKLHGCGELGDA